MGLFRRLKDSLAKTRQGFVEKVENLVTGRKNIDEGLYEELEEIMIEADMGVDVALDLVEKLRREVKERKIKDAVDVKPVLQDLIKEMLGGEIQPSLFDAPPSSIPMVIMVVGVNGVGKTTTIGKLAHIYKSRGQKVILGAGDTFRAAAIEQLEIWGHRVGADVIKHQHGADPAAVAYDSLQAARARHADVLIIDTAGRLHTKSNLMEELKKISRVLKKELPDAPHETLLVLDATTGQNAISQAQIFDEAIDVTGIALTKLDGTAKGGVVVAVNQTFQIPIKLIGIGEGIEDLREFAPQEFAAALFDDPEQA